jgi:hypothetical protein
VRQPPILARRRFFSVINAITRIPAAADLLTQKPQLDQVLDVTQRGVMRRFGDLRPFRGR